MLLPRDELVDRQSSRSPCPSGNGTMIGDEQQFNVFCNTRFRGDEVLRQKVDSLTTCAGLCTSFQNPRCEGVQFRRNRDCVLLGHLVPQGTRPSRFSDGAAAIFPQPGPTSSCSQKGTGASFPSSQVDLNSSFTLNCGRIINGNDLEQQFHMTFESCLDACSSNPACGGVSYDPLQSSGFRNCYLKTVIDPSNMFVMTGVDSAILVKNTDTDQAMGNNGDGIAETTGTTAVASLPSNAISQPAAFVTVTTDTGNEVGSVVTVSVPVPVTPALSTSTGALADSTPSASPAGAASSPSANENGRGGGGVNNSQRPKFPGGIGSSSSSSNAWIAAPVIGGIAALTLILAVFVLWGRRRRRDNHNNSQSPSSLKDSGRPSGNSHMSKGTFSTFGKGLGNAANQLYRGRFFGSDKFKLGMGDSDQDDDEPRHKRSGGGSRSGFKVISGSGRRLGLDGQELPIPGTGPGLGGMIVTAGRGRVVNINTNPYATANDSSGGGGAAQPPPPPPRPASPAAGLRDSQNGLRQNRLSGNWLGSLNFLSPQPGIPAEFRGPDFK
ncbi:hypothetical protein F4808DRAFT_433561 [Astrocystis sublimbata]|nr:hypothetical protein F4808DRAFT_433561 [Astrocystis sublimbata]